MCGVRMGKDRELHRTEIEAKKSWTPFNRTLMLLGALVLPRQLSSATRVLSSRVRWRGQSSSVMGARSPPEAPAQRSDVALREAWYSFGVCFPSPFSVAL